MHILIILCDRLFSVLDNIAQWRGSTKVAFHLNFEDNVGGDNSIPDFWDDEMASLHCWIEEIETSFVFGWNNREEKDR